MNCVYLHRERERQRHIASMNLNFMLDFVFSAALARGESFVFVSSLRCVGH